MTALAVSQYDANHPSALGLDGFERNAVEPGEFKELVRRTFNLKLTGREVGAVFKMFDSREGLDEEEDYTPVNQVCTCLWQ